MRKFLVLWLALVLLFAVSYHVNGAAKVQKITIVMTDFRFTPSASTLQAGIPAEVTLVNHGAVTHEVSIYAKPPVGQKLSDWDDWVIPNTYFQGIGEVQVELEGRAAVAGTNIFEFEVAKGQSVTIKFVPTRKGTFELACHQPAHYEAGMQGSFVVK